MTKASASDLAAPELFGAGDGTLRLAVPPGIDVVALREGGDAFLYAQTIAAERGAGTLVVVRRFDLIEFALVMEPEEPLSAARRVLYLGLNAMADALGAVCPPERPLLFRWPDAILFDGGLVGGARLAWPAGAAEDAPPDWLVFSGMLRTAVVRRPETGISLEPGTWTVGTALDVEGFENLDPAALLESVVRHIMLHLDLWQERGFKAVARDYLSRLPVEAGLRRGIDGNGDLLSRRDGETAPPARTALLLALAAEHWYDPDTREPRL